MKRSMLGWELDPWALTRGPVPFPPVGRGGPIWETVSIVFKIYVYSVLLKIHGDWHQDAGDGRKVFLGLTVIRLAGGTRCHICWDRPKMVSPDSTHEQLLRFLKLTIAGSWQRKPSNLRGLVIIRNMEGGLKPFWIDCWEKGWNMEGGLKSWIDCWKMIRNKGRWFKVLLGRNGDR